MRTILHHSSTFSLGWRQSLAIYVVAIVVNGCDPATTAPPPQAAAPTKPNLVYDPSTGVGCWPISSTCHDRALTSAEVSQAIQAIAGYYFNTYADEDCSRIIDMAFNRLNSGNARFWTDPPDTLTSGDSHRTISPQLIHITANPFNTSNLELAKTVIHEAAHLLNFGHPSAYFFEETCF